MAEKTPLQLALMIEALERRVERLERDARPPVDFADLYGRGRVERMEKDHSRK